MGSRESLEMVTGILKNKSATSKLIVVVSAMSGVTDSLLNLAKQAKNNSFNPENFLELENKHFQVLTHFQIPKENSALEKIFQELNQALTYKTLIEETQEITYFDFIASFGERLSATLLTQILKSKELDTQYLDSRDFLITDSNFSNANLNWKQSGENWSKLETEMTSKILVLTGFIARSETGATTTLGRGGSDYTAGVMANLTNSKTVEIWTDVDGILSTDPRIVSEAKLIEKMSYREAFEVAYYGGKVLYPKTIEACLPKKIEIKIKNTFYPDNLGTSIVEEETAGLKVISLAKKITLIEVIFGANTSEIGLLAYIFSEFAKENLTVDVVTTSGDSVAFSSDKTPSKKLIENVSNRIGPVTIWENQEIVAAIGAKLNQQKSFSKILELMSEVEPKMLSMNTKNTNLTVVVSQNQGQNLIKQIHELLI